MRELSWAGRQDAAHVPGELAADGMVPRLPSRARQVPAAQEDGWRPARSGLQHDIRAAGSDEPSDGGFWQGPREVHRAAQFRWDRIRTAFDQGEPHPRTARDHQLFDVPPVSTQYPVASTQFWLLSSTDVNERWIWILA